MEGHGELDAAGRAASTGVRASFRALLFALIVVGAAFPTVGTDDQQRLQTVKKLYQQKQWEEVVREARGPSSQSADFDYYAGMALAGLERWSEAQEAFSAGARKAPAEARFLTERAGAEYRLNQLAAAKHDLLRSWQLDPTDSYVPEFLGTIYLLQGNTEAALKYWNRLDRPKLSSVLIVPSSKTDKRLLLRAIVFAPPATLERSSLLKTESLLANLEVFPQARVELAPEPEAQGDDRYRATLKLGERAGWGTSLVEGAISLFRGVTYQTVYPSYYNFARRAVNFESLVRWDSEKRRTAARLTFPLFQQPNKRLRLFFDQRDENWNLSETFQTGSIGITDLNFRRFAGGAELRLIESGSWGLELGGQVAAREFRNVPVGLPGPAASFLVGGKSADTRLSAYRSLLRVPERRFTIDVSGEVSVGRNYAHGLGVFGGVRGELKTRWLPKATGDDYEFTTRWRAGDTYGAVTLDQLYQLGAERDNDLWLRGHGGTLGGRKGRAPLGRRFAVFNADFFKTVHDGTFFRLQIGPFLDTGAIADSSGVIGSREWLVDSGIQARVRVLGTISVALSYGRDLRNGGGLFYGNTPR